MMEWRIYFLLGKEEPAKKLAEFLTAHLDPAFTFRQEAGKVVVENVDTKDRAWRTAIWIKNQSGLKPRFVIEARENGKIIWLSNCSLCRDGGRHDEH